jgi:UDP-2-acetamido-3-amino-2,3-dideoxy-glucuronate N-acetyltransferase
MTGLEPSPLAPGLVTGARVQLGTGVTIGAYVVIHDDVRIADGCTIQDGAILGKIPKVGPLSTSPDAAREPTVLDVGATISSRATVCIGAHIGRGAVIGDQSLIREGVRIGAGSVVGLACGVGRGVSIGTRVRLQSNVQVGTGSLIEDDVFIGPLVVFANDITMGRHASDTRPSGAVLRRGCRIGASAVLMPGIEVGEEAVVGAGAVVTRDVAPRTVVIGSPARAIRAVRPDELLEARR